MVPGLTEMDEDQAYRAMDLLVEADAQAQVQEAVFFAVADLLNLEVDLLFFDTTTTYFERDTEEAPSEEQPAGGLRRYGHSKDSRADLPQIVIGLAVTREGIPVRCWVWPGNTDDVAVLPEVKDGLRGWRLGRVVTVVDRGFSSDANLDYLRRAGGHWIAGERMRDGNPRAQAALSRQGRYRRSGTTCGSRKSGSTPRDRRRVGVRWIVCHNPLEAERDKTRRELALARLTAELDRIRPPGPATPSDARPARRPPPTTSTSGPSARCVTTRRWAAGCVSCRSGRLVLDRAKITAEERLDGKYLLSTSDPDLSAEDVALGYKNLLEAERGFRDLKSTLELRPVFHRIEPRIRAHVLLCWLALLLIRVAERRTGLTWRRIASNSAGSTPSPSPAPPAPSSRPPR